MPATDSAERLQFITLSGRVFETLLAILVALFPIQAISRTACERLASLSLPDTAVIVARDVPAGWSLNLAISGIDAKEDLPAFCRVSLVVTPQINIEVWLPEVSWNRRFRGEGGGGYAGKIRYDFMAEALRAGYATASTDTGHPFYVGGAFALNADGSLNQQLIGDFAFRSLHELALKAKRLIHAYYGVPPEYSYWRGCSGGGREGLMAVQRFPEEYDGVLAECPGLNWDRLLPAWLWPQIVMREEVGHTISSVKLEFARKAAVAACDNDDGVLDEIISDPRRCAFDPMRLVCGESGNANTCLTAEEAVAVRRMWDGPTNVKTGAQLWFGLERGASLSWLAGSQPFSLAVDHFQYWVRQDPSVDWRTVTAEEFERDFRLSQAKFNKLVGTDDPNLREFRRRGGKLIILHGEADEAVPPRGTLDYFNRVVSANGAQQVNDFVRLYMLPGVAHTCSWYRDEKAGPFPRDVFDALVAWVERGITPGSLMGSQKLPSGSTRTRPLCPYPKKAQWSGKGNPDDAADYTCVTEGEKWEVSSANVLSDE